MLSPYRINPNNTNKRIEKVSNNKSDNNSHHDLDVKRPQMTSNDIKRPQSSSNENGKKVKTKNNLKSRLVQENVEINDHNLAEIPQINNP